MWDKLAYTEGREGERRRKINRRELQREDGIEAEEEKGRETLGLY